jgi:peptide/nickel transport system substrate-binding protein
MRKRTTLFVLTFMVAAMVFSVTPVFATEEDDVIPLIYGLTSSPPGVDPLNFYDTTSSDIAINHLEGLYAFDYSDPSMPQIPRLATTMGEWNTAGTEWTIPLRDDVLWHDGDPFTADDVVWNWERLQFLAENYTAEHSSLWYNDEGEIMFSAVTAVDEHTVKFTLPKAWTDFALLQSFAGCYMIKPVTGKEEELIELDEIDLIVGTGPFILDSLVAEDKTVLVANDDYYRGRPDIDKLIFQVFADGDTYNQALLNKEIHVCRSITPDNMAAVEEDPDLVAHEQVGSCCYFYHLNVNNIPLAARKAIQYAFNYTYAVDILYSGSVIEHHSPVPEGMFGYNPDLDGLPYYDLTIARQFLLDDPTYGAFLTAEGIDEDSTDEEWKTLATDNPVATFNFTHYGTGTWRMLQDNMEYIGIHIVDFVVGNWGAFLSSDLSDAEIVMGGWCPDYFAAINQIEPMFASTGSANYNGMTDAGVDALCAEAHTLVGDDLAAKIDEIVTEVIVNKAAAMYFMQSVEYIGYNSAVCKNVDDLFNASYDKYFYNVRFTLNDKPGIPGFAFWSLMVASLGAAALIIRKRD